VALFLASNIIEVHRGVLLRFHFGDFRNSLSTINPSENNYMKINLRKNCIGACASLFMAAVVLTGIQRAAGQGDYGAAVAAGNFNGQSEQTYSTCEIAVGAPDETNGFIYIYAKTSSAGGTNWNVYRKGATDFGGPAGANFGGFGTSFAVGDFNGDGCMDLAIGCPYETVDGKADAGAVYILYGATNAIGAWPFGSYRRITADDAFPYPIDGPQTSGYFGLSLSAGDFNGDGLTDLAVGAPGTPVSALSSAGAVYVFHSVLPAGDLTEDEYTYYPGGPYGPNVGTVAADNEFGFSLASGNFNGKYHGTFGDGGQQGMSVKDLAVGTPNATVGSATYAGNVTVLYGGSAYLNDSSAQAPQLWTENNTGGSAQANEAFGTTLLGGSFSRNLKLWYDSLVIGSPYATVAGKSDAGKVRVLLGSSTGVTSTGSQLFYPGAVVGGYTNAPGVSPQAFAYFGFALAAGDVFNQNDGGCQGSGCEPQELIIGEPYRTLNAHPANGSIYVISGQPGLGLSLVLQQVIGGPGSNATFGIALATGQVGLWNGQNLGGGNSAPNALDIIVGAPGYNLWQWGIYFGDFSDVDTTHPFFKKYY
jgi:hypothetical protein